MPRVRVRKPRWTSRQIAGGRVLTLWAGRIKLQRFTVEDGRPLSWAGVDWSYGGRQWECGIDPDGKPYVWEIL